MARQSLSLRETITMSKSRRSQKISVGIVGTGIAGMGCAYFLQSSHEIFLYEKNAYVGGHTNTVCVEEDGKEIPIDTGFMVYNQVTYPNLTRLFGELQVETKNTSMSFSVQHVPSGLEYCGSSVNHLFAQRKNLFNPAFIKMLMEIRRFNAESPEVLENDRFADYTIDAYVRERGYGRNVIEKYLIPMSSAVWSTPPDQMLRFPAVTLVRFFKNHGFLGLNAQHQWRTVVNGTRTYRDSIISPFVKKIRTDNPVVKVIRKKEKVELRFKDGKVAMHDLVILACHADEALTILDKPTAMEKKLLKEFRYQQNTATLHTDDRLMPKTTLAWSSWNYRLDADRNGNATPSTIYYMNSLQGLPAKKNYFVSINDPGIVAPGSVLKEIDYTHPIFSLGAIKAQEDLSQLNHNGPVYFCGSYFKYGFHEDAFTSALELCRKLRKEPIWTDEARGAQS
jgi:predicted NAD/FAD-binding protein